MLLPGQLLVLLCGLFLLSRDRAAVGCVIEQLVTRLRRRRGCCGLWLELLERRLGRVCALPEASHLLLLLLAGVLQCAHLCPQPIGLAVDLLVQVCHLLLLLVQGRLTLLANLSGLLQAGGVLAASLCQLTVLCLLRRAGLAKPRAGSLEGLHGGGLCVHTYL